MRIPIMALMTVSVSRNLVILWNIFDEPDRKSFRLMTPAESSVAFPPPMDTTFDIA